MTAAGWPGIRRARRAAQWGKKKYAGSLAEDVWRRLDTMDFINRGMVFAATLLLCLFPFLIVVSALAGRPAAQSLTRQTGLNSQAAADIGHLFASSAATTRAVVGTTTMVFFVFGGIFAAAALQQIYEQAFDLPHRRIKDLPHRLAWLAVLIGASLLSGWAGPGLRHAGGPALLAVTGLVCATGFWWLTMQILLAGRLSWRALFPAACATGMLYIAMQAVFSLVFSAMVISDEHTYGPIGTIFAVLSYLIAIGVVVILGAVAGRAWHERSPGTSETGQLPPAEHEDARRSGRGAVAFGDSEVSPPPSDVQPPGCRPAGRRRATPQRVSRTAREHCKLDLKVASPRDNGERPVPRGLGRAAAGDQFLLGRGMPEGGRLKPATWSLQRSSGHAHHDHVYLRPPRAPQVPSAAPPLTTTPSTDRGYGHQPPAAQRCSLVPWFALSVICPHASPGADQHHQQLE